MAFTSQSSAQYSVLDLGYDKLLTRNLLALQGTPPEMTNEFTSAAIPRTIIAGELLSVLEQKAGVIFSGKTAFDNTQSGYRLGIDTDGIAKFYIGNTTSYLNWTGTALSIAGAISASTIDIGGSDATSFHVDADGNMWLGAATYAASTARISNAGAATFSSIAITGGSISGILNSTATDVSLLEKTHNLVFSVTDADTIAWAAGTIIFSNGRTFAIDAGNTGNMAALTYIYLDTAVSSTVLQTTTTYSTAMGANKSLIGMAQNNTATAMFIPYGAGQPLIDGSNIGNLSIVAGKLSVSQLSAISADLGAMTAGSISVVAGGNTIGFTPAGANAIFSGPTGSPTFKVTPAGVLTATGSVINGRTFVPGAGATSRAGNAASGTQTIAHGIGTTPKMVKITTSYTETGTIKNSIGIYNGSTTICNFFSYVSGTGEVSGTDTTNIINIEQLGVANSQVATIAVDATNITLTWTMTGLGAGTSGNSMFIMWEVEG